MSTKPMKPLPKQKVQVDLKDAETMKCQKCENTIFIQGYVVKKNIGNYVTNWSGSYRTRTSI